jgi:hypothetical protein
MYRGTCDLSSSALSGLDSVMCHNIVSKLKKVGAISKERAVTIEEAELNSREQNWLPYFAGVFLGEIKKTDDKRYYV